MSLTQQIMTIEEMKQHILSVAREASGMKDEVISEVNHLRQEGLLSEVADNFMGPLYMGHVNEELDKLLDRMCREDYAYLDRVQQKIEDVLRL